MKVGIFTFPNSTSYGAELQMYALYRAVESLGHTPEIVNYHNAYMKAQKHTSQRGLLKKTVGLLLHYRLHDGFRRFEKNLIRYPQRAFSDPTRLPKVAKHYDAMICGSDQVWNPDITGGDLSYFLDFCGRNTRRIAYAPSFGIDTFSPDFCDRIKGELERFDAISVREVAGQNLIRELLGKDIPIVADPTFLLTSEEWSALEQRHSLAEGEYILYYTIRSSQTLWKKALAFSRKTGLKLVVVGGNWLKKALRKEDNVEYAVDITPGQWLYLLHRAQYVVTNSFHGTAFSVNYRKDFYVELSSLTNSRLLQITQALELTTRIAGESALEAKAVDYTVTDRVLPQMRKESMDYLVEALK